MVTSIVTSMLAAAVAVAEVSAQEGGPPAHPTADAPAAVCAVCGSAECGEAIDGELVLTTTTHYFFRGLIQEDQGLIFQPSLTLSTGLWQGDGGLQEIGLSLNSWNSLHSGPTGTGGVGTHSPSAWYESDFAIGLSFGMACGTALSATWIEYTSPNGLWDTTSELDFVVDLSGTEWIGEAASLSPSLTLAIEVDGQTDQNTAPAGTDEGTFLGLGIAPEFDLGTLGSSSLPLTLSTPINVGFSLGDYYEDGTGDDDTFGYADVGVFASFPLAAVSPHYGAWVFSIGTQLVFLNGNQEDLNHDAGVEWTGTMALSIGF